MSLSRTAAPHVYDRTSTSTWRCAVVTKAALQSVAMADLGADLMRPQAVSRSQATRRHIVMTGHYQASAIFPSNDPA
jgi:hypothetical protein